MKNDISNIIESFYCELELLQVLEKLSKKKTTYLSVNDIVELDEIIKKEQVVLMKFAFHQSKIRKNINQIKTKHNIKDNLNLKTLNKYCDKKQKELIKNLIKEQKKVIDKLVSHNYTNKKLINYKMGVLDILLQSSPKDEYNYTKDTRRKVSDKGTIDERI